MKILLVKPAPRLKTISSLHRLLLLEPLELGYIAAAVPEKHTVRVLDLRLKLFPDYRFIEELKKYKPDVVAISAYTHEVSKVKEMTRIVKKNLPAATVIVGGHHATVLPEDYNIASIDAIVRGEGCAPFRSVIEAIEDMKELTKIPNVLVTGENFDKQSARELPVYPDLLTVPIPRRDLWNIETYRCIWPSLKHPPWTTIFPAVSLVRSSFGCTMNCTFCVVPRLCNRKHLKCDPQSVADEIASLKTGHIYFCDDETFLDEQHAWNVALAIKGKNIKKRYFAWARATTVNKSPELFKFWKDIGLDAVFLGFEASSDKELNDISKHATTKDNEKAHKKLIDLGIASQIGFMVRADFTKDDFDRLMNYVKALPPAQVTFTVFTPSPGSAAWKDENGKFIANPYDLHDCMHPLTKTALPLKEFYKYFCALVDIGGAKNPLRSPKAKLLPQDICRAIFAVITYSRSMKRAHLDYKGEIK